MKINPSRPLDQLAGANYGIVCNRLGRIHCMTPRREQLRAARPLKMRSIPPALRRGWAKCVHEIMYENRDLFAGVMSGNLEKTPKP